MKKRKTKKKKSSKKSHPPVAIIMGSDSDFPVMKDATLALEELDVHYQTAVISAHRTPDEMMKFAKSAVAKGFKVIIAGAGGAAHLPGMVASLTPLPVIGVPIAVGPLEGQDSLLSIVQMPKGVPVGTVAINNAYNAGLLACQILAAGGEKSNPTLINKIKTYKIKMRSHVLKKKLKK